MPFNGSGVFNRLFNWTQDAANDVPITAARFDDENDDFASAFSKCLTRDGQSTMQADFDMANFAIRRLAAPSLDTDGVNLGYLKENYLNKLAGGIDQYSAGITLVDNFAASRKSGWYRWSASSLGNPNAAGGGGALFIPRTTTQGGPNSYGWLAFDSSSATPRLFLQSTTGAGNDPGPWNEVLAVNNADNIVGRSAPTIFGGPVSFASPVVATAQITAPSFALGGILNAAIGISSNNLTITGDAGDALVYDRATNRWIVTVEGQETYAFDSSLNPRSVLKPDSADVRYARLGVDNVFAGQLTATSLVLSGVPNAAIGIFDGNVTITGDSGDAWLYDRSTDRWVIIRANEETYSFDSTLTPRSVLKPETADARYVLKSILIDAVAAVPVDGTVAQLRSAILGALV